MKYSAIFLIVFGILVIAMPEILAYLLWSFLIFVWVSILLATNMFNKTGTKWQEEYVQFWKYKIFTNKK